MQNTDEVTKLLGEMSQGSRRAADKLIPLVHAELKNLAKRYMAGESSGHTLQATALVNEAYIKLANVGKIDWKSRSHFFAVSANTMRRILVDHARKKVAEKRGGSNINLSLDEGLVADSEKDLNIIALDDALKALAQKSERQASIVEMRFFSGMTVDEIANHFDCSKRKIEGEWTIIKAWLKRELSNEEAI